MTKAVSPDAPENEELPDCRHSRGKQQAAGNKAQSAANDPSEPITLEQHRRKGTQ
jgi:hypothetical protein